MADEFVSMTKAAEELGISPDALKQAISKREISALLDGGTFKIRRSDLDRYKARRQSEETITLPAEAAEELEELAEGEEVAEAEVAEPTLEAIEEVADTVDTEITLDELETVAEEPNPVGPAEPATAELASESSEATQEISLEGEEPEPAPLSDDLELESEGDAKTVSLEGEELPAAEAGFEGQQELTSLEEGGPSEGLDERVYELEAVPQGSSFFAAMMVLTSLALLFVGMTLWGYPKDHVPGFLEWMIR